MQQQITARKIKLSEDNKAHIGLAIESFNKFGLPITTINTTVSAFSKGVKVEFEVRISHAQPVQISQEDKDLSTAIDKAIDRGQKALRRIHDKKIRGKKSAQKPEIQDEEVE